MPAPSKSTSRASRKAAQPVVGGCPVGRDPQCLAPVLVLLPRSRDGRLRRGSLDRHRHVAYREHPGSQDLRRGRHPAVGVGVSHRHTDASRPARGRRARRQRLVVSADEPKRAELTRTRTHPGAPTPAAASGKPCGLASRRAARRSASHRRRAHALPTEDNNAIHRQWASAKARA